MKKTGYAAPKKPGKNEFADVRIAIVSARWNVGVVDALSAGAQRCLAKWGVAVENISEYRAPGAFELPLAAATILRSESKHTDGVIALGAVIRGDTPHFDFVAGECARGLMDVQLATGRPVGFGVLTVNTAAQAQERAGADDSNKGFECAAAVLEMIRLSRLANGDAA